MDAFFSLFFAFLFFILIVAGALSSLDWQRKNRGEAVRREHEFYFFRFFYFNPDDKRIMLTKRGGGGYTLNLGNPFSWALILLLSGWVLYSLRG